MSGPAGQKCLPKIKAPQGEGCCPSFWTPSSLCRGARVSAGGSEGGGKGPCPTQSRGASPHRAPSSGTSSAATSSGLLPPLGLQVHHPKYPQDIRLVMPLVGPWDPSSGHKPVLWGQRDGHAAVQERMWALSHACSLAAEPYQCGAPKSPKYSLPKPLDPGGADGGNALGAPGSLW